MPQLATILVIYFLITVVSILTFVIFFNSNKKQILQFDNIRIKLRREVRADLIHTLKPLSILSANSNNRLWMNASHRLDMHSQLDQKIIYNGEHIISQLYNWTTIKHLLDSNQVSIDYSLAFAKTTISPEASILITTLASFYFNSIKKNQELNISIEIVKREIVIRFTTIQGNNLPQLPKKIQQQIYEQNAKISVNSHVVIVRFDQ